MLICEKCHSIHGCKFPHSFSTDKKENEPLPTHDLCGICFKKRTVFECRAAKPPVLYTWPDTECLTLSLCVDDRGSVKLKPTLAVMELRGKNLDKLIEAVELIQTYRKRKDIDK